MQKKAVIGGVAAAAVVVGIGSWWAVDAAVESATSERGTCGGATWELSAEAEDGGTEELVRGDTSVLTGERTTDENGEIDVDAYASGNPGDATYTVTFTPADGEPCTATLGG